MAFKAIPVVAAKVAATQTNFPVYIQPSAMTGWGSLTLAEAQSLRFYADESKTTELAREVVSADEIHVKVPSLTTTTIIYADYDGVRADYAVTDTYGRNAVWADYELVMHLNNDPSGTAPQMIDSTGNGYNGTSSGSMTSADSISAKLGNGIAFDGTDDAIQAGTTNWFPNLNSDFNISAWAKVTDTTSNTSGIFGYQSNLNTNYPYILFMHRADQGGITMQSDIGTGGAVWPSSAGAVTQNVWHRVSVFRNYTNASTQTVQIYVDNTKAVDVSFVVNFAATRTDHRSCVGNWAVGSGNSMDGDLDEVRVKTTEDSLNWITTEYNNQNDVASFWGTVTDVAGGIIKPNFAGFGGL